MKINWLTYQIDQINFKTGHIQLNAYREDGTIENTYPILFSSDKEIDEVKEVETENLVVERVPGEHEGDEPKPTTVNDPKFEIVKTGKKISNPNYVDPRDKKALEKWLIDTHGFTN